MTRVRFATARLATGPQLHYAEQGEPEGQAVIFLHGWPDSWFSFSRVLELLPPRLHVFAPDQRGFGDSERPDRGYSIEQFAEDVAAFLDATAVDRATVVGHSFGSFVARRVAIAHPDRVARLVLIGTGLTPANPVTREVQSTLPGLSDPISPPFARDFQASTVYAPVPEMFFEQIVAESLKLPARLWRDVFDALLTYDDADVLAAIGARTLLIWGEHDALFPGTDQDRVTDAVRDATLKVYPDTGHCPNWERPEQVAADLVEFLDGA
jgi:pimeloyl-ACP methyl ester carboxylesterase